VLWAGKRVPASHELRLRFTRVVNAPLTESAQRSQLMVSAEANLAPSDTSPRVAFLASQGLADPASLSLDDVRAVCATALARVPDHRQVEIVDGRPYYEQIDMALALARYEEPPESSMTDRGLL